MVLQFNCPINQEQIEKLTKLLNELSDLNAKYSLIKVALTHSE